MTDFHTFATRGNKTNVLAYIQQKIFSVCEEIVLLSPYIIWLFCSIETNSFNSRKQNTKQKIQMLSLNKLNKKYNNQFIQKYFLKFQIFQDVSFEKYKKDFPLRKIVHQELKETKIPRKTGIRKAAKRDIFENEINAHLYFCESSKAQHRETIASELKHTTQKQNEELDFYFQKLYPISESDMVAEFIDLSNEIHISPQLK